MTDERIIYLNTAAAGMVPPNYRKKVGQFYEQLAINPAKTNEQWNFGDLNDLRSDAAEMLDAHPDEIAFVPNFSYALNALVHSLDPQMRVMVLYEEYPSVTDPFRLNGFNIHRFKSPKKLHFNTEDIIVEMLASNIQILAISHVQWLSGFKADLQRLGDVCRQRGILLIVDATQSMGAIPISLKKSGADVIISSNYKWMNAGFGTGIMCVRTDFLERYKPRIRGMNSRMLVGGDWENDASILGYEPGHHNTPGLVILKEAIREKLQTGIDRVHAHNMSLCEILIDTLKNSSVQLIGPESTTHRSSIVSLRGGEALHQYLTEKGFVVSLRNKLVRISFHYHNTEKEAEELVRVLNEYSPA